MQQPSPKKIFTRMECKNANNFIVWSFNRKYKVYEEEFHTFAVLLRQAQISKRSGYFCREISNNRKHWESWICYLQGDLEQFSLSLSHQNYTFCTQKILLVTLRHPRSLGFQLCMPIFHIHLCTVGQFVFTWPKIWNCPQGQTKPNKIFIFINFNPG